MMGLGTVLLAVKARMSACWNCAGGRNFRRFCAPGESLDRGMMLFGNTAPVKASNMTIGERKGLPVAGLMAGVSSAEKSPLRKELGGKKAVATDSLVSRRPS